MLTGAGGHGMEVRPLQVVDELLRRWRNCTPTLNIVPTPRVPTTCCDGFSENSTPTHEPLGKSISERSGIAFINLKKRSTIFQNNINSSKRAKQASERDFQYQNIMRNLVRRYVTEEQRKADNQGVTEDDVNEIKQDISSFRYELTEILQNSGLTPPPPRDKRRGRQKERRLMKGFDIGLVESSIQTTPEASVDDTNHNRHSPLAPRWPKSPDSPPARRSRVGGAISWKPRVTPRQPSPGADPRTRSAVTGPAATDPAAAVMGATE
ncbi:transient receptor potential-gamma protein [Caerostris extrusa]|uniref:Transient receptor potential-gamma protein n=1 Tax=Caerostris extrusa TaxID=172846 RepID=A0AAV4QQ08_CAEEX|nr:transient receptor potential-gamma protein [Caerostris extrusa]